MVERDYPEVRLIRNESNSGFARANNQAAQVARGQYLLFLNNDTVVPPYAVAKLAAYLENHPEAAILGPRLRDENGKIQAAYRSQPTVATFLHRTLLLRWTGLFRSRYRAFRRHPFADLFPHAADVLMGAAVMLRRKTFDKLSGWDEAYTFGGEDMDLCYRARQLGQVVHHPGVTIIHHGRASSRNNPAFAAPHIAVGFLKYLRKTGSSRLGLWAYKLALTLDLPLQFLIRGAEWLWRRIRGQRARATQTANHLRAHWAFARRGLREFWRT
jgi:GT2 family glycosyltransferase